MFHYGYKPTNNINKDIPNIGILKNNINNFLEPIVQTNIKIDPIYYHDSFEISLLRFIHIIFGEGNKINMDKVRYLMGDSYENNELYNFLAQNIKFEKKSGNYTNSYFLKQRMEWCRFLNNRPFFNYKFDNKYKLCSSLGNIFAFFWYFFPFKFKSTNDHKTLSKLMDFLSIDNEFSAKLFKNGYIGRDKSFEELTIKLYINDNNLYDWYMYQYFEYNDNIVSCEISGNSELKYSVYLEKIYTTDKEEICDYSLKTDISFDSDDSDCSTETFPMTDNVEYY